MTHPYFRQYLTPTNAKPDKLVCNLTNAPELLYNHHYHDNTTVYY